MRIAPIIAALLLLSAACSKEDEDVLSKQKERMISYLESTHNPRLIFSEEVEEGTYRNGYRLPDMPTE